METLKVLPYDGLIKRFPLHRIASKDKQYAYQLKNLIALDNKIKSTGFTERINSADLGGSVSWSKRIYYNLGTDKKRRQFAVINRKMYRLNEDTKTVSQMTINDSLDHEFETGFPMDTDMKVSGNTVKFMADGRFLYKFVPNDAGAWERLPILTDVDGNDIEPIDCIEYLDCLWVLCKNRNVILKSKNENPEVFNVSNDSALIETPAGFGGYPQRLMIHRGFLYVIHEDYISPVSGTSTATFGIRPGDVIYGFGTRAPRSVISLKKSFGFLNSYDNEYYLSSGTLDSTTDEPLSYPIELSRLMNPYQSSRVVAHHDTKLNAIRISYVPSGESLLNAEAIYSLNEKKWCGETYGQHIQTYSQWSGPGDQQELLIGRSDAGRLMFLDQGQTLDTGALKVKFVSAEYLVGETDDVQFEDLYGDFKPSGNWTLPVTYFMDSRLTTNGSENMNLQGELLNPGFLIDLADQKEFLNRAQFLLDKSKGRSIRFEIDVELTNKELEFYGLYARYNKGASVFSKHISGR